MRKLRWALVLLAVVLVAVVAGYIGYARYKLRAAIHDLPKVLGMDITQETDGYTYSQTLKGKTIFTVHAAKEIQHKNGLITLKDVGIILYGTEGTRADRIHGQEFEYDAKNGTLRAVGEALIEMGPPGDKVADEAHMIHVKTSGLVFRKDAGTAETSEGVQFSANGLVGEAIGAAYSSKTNVLVLQSAVKVSGLRGEAGKERPVVLTAARAEMDRAQNTLLLDAPRYTSTGEAGGESAAADKAVVHTGADGKPKDVEARGHVRLAGEGRGRIDAERMDVTLNDDGQPRDGHLYGGVNFANETPARQEQGRAEDVRVGFDGAGRARHALLTGAVQMEETAGRSSRRLVGDHVDLALDGGGKQKVVLRGAVASGADGARLRLVDGSDKGTTATDVRANTLTGRFGPAGLTGLDGAGKTRLERVELNANGVQMLKETSTGETLGIELRSANHKGRMEVARATQRGSVEVIREAVAKKAGAPLDVEHARAAAADYDADRDELTLTGGAEVSDALSAVFADKVQLERATGDAVAEGAVRVSYAQGKSTAEPVHVLASHAVFHKATGLAHFTGTAVRMWQGGSQVEAPVLDIDRNTKNLTAFGGDSTVHATLARQPAKPGAKVQAPISILSERMTYTDASRQLDFAGQVLIKEAAGTLHAQDALVFLSAAGAKADPAENLFGGKLDHVIGTGDVLLEEPGRKALGDRIVYTAADEQYVLTGTRAVPPRMTDETRGSVTGSQLRFKRGDESVEVVGGEGGRVRSEPRAKQ